MAADRLSPLRDVGRICLRSDASCRESTRSRALRPPWSGVLAIGFSRAGTRSIGRGRRLRPASMSKHTLVAMRYSQDRIDPRLSNRSKPRNAWMKVSWTASSASGAPKHPTAEGRDPTRCCSSSSTAATKLGTSAVVAARSRGWRANRFPSLSWNIDHQPKLCSTGGCGNSTPRAPRLLVRPRQVVAAEEDVRCRRFRGRSVARPAQEGEHRESCSCPAYRPRANAPRLRACRAQAGTQPRPPRSAARDPDPRPRRRAFSHPRSRRHLLSAAWSGDPGRSRPSRRLRWDIVGAVGHDRFGMPGTATDSVSDEGGELAALPMAHRISPREPRQDVESSHSSNVRAGERGLPGRAGGRPTQSQRWLSGKAGSLALSIRPGRRAGRRAASPRPRGVP